MEKTITVINLHFLKIRDFFKEHKKWNPFENKWLFCFIPVLIGWICAIHYHAMYQTSDDWEMRISLEGSVGGVQYTQPSEFSMYMNVLYGKFLKFFYTLYQGGYWYDIFTYLFCSLSIYVISLVCCNRFDQQSLFKKLANLLILSFVGATPFVSPQFTLTSGVLAISGVLSFYCLTNNPVLTGKEQAFYAIYCFFALLFSSLIRFENCMVCAFFTGLVLLPYWNYRDWKGIAKKSYVIFLSLVAIGGGVYADSILVKNNPQWNHWRKFNTARVEITDKSEMWDSIEQPWEKSEKKVDELTQNGFSFTKGDYRLLLSFLLFGNKPAFDVENLQKASKELAPKVQTANSISAGFRIKDYQGVFPYFCGLYLLIAVFFAKKRKSAFFELALLFVFVCALNVEFRALPYRLWYNFAFATTIGLLLAIGNEHFTINNKTFKLIALLSAVFCSFNIMYGQAFSTRYQYRIYKKINKDLNYIKTDEIFMTNYSLEDHIAAPFRKNVFLKNKLHHYGWIDMHKAKMISDYKISKTDTWLDICSKGSKFRFLASDWVYNPYIDIKKAVSYFIKEKYQKNIVFKRKNISENLYTLQCRILTNKERNAFDDYIREIIEPYHNQYGRFEFAKRKVLSKKREDVLAYLKLLDESPYIWPFLQMEFARKHLGKNASAEELQDFIQLMDAEKVDWGYFYDKEKIEQEK